MLRKGHVATDRSRDHSGGMGHSIEDTQDRDRGGKSLVSCAAQTTPPNPYRGQGIQSKRGVRAGSLYLVRVCLSPGS